MTYNPDIHHRRSIRLKGYDYSLSGAYFVTICVHDRKCLFGEIIDGEMRMNMFGEMAEKAWGDLPNHYPYVELDQFVVMPNHFHGIITIGGGAGLVGAGLVGAGLKPAPTVPETRKRHGLSEIVRAFKTFSARRINEIRKSPGIPVWQRNYYEHVIRDDADYNRIAEYVIANPQRWIEDKLHPDNFVVGDNVDSKTVLGGNGNMNGNGNIRTVMNKNMVVGNGNIVGRV